MIFNMRGNCFLSEKMLIKNQDDLVAFKEIYDITEEIEKRY